MPAGRSTRAGEIANRAVRTFFTSRPGSRDDSVRSVRPSIPAAAISTTASASWLTTKMPCSHSIHQSSFDRQREDRDRHGEESGSRGRCRRTAPCPWTARAQRSRPAHRRGSRGPTADSPASWPRADRAPRVRPSIPNAPPQRLSHALSVRHCLSRRPRPAPSAVRSANSRSGRTPAPASGWRCSRTQSTERC